MNISMCWHRAIDATLWYDIMLYIIDDPFCTVGLRYNTTNHNTILRTFWTHGINKTQNLQNTPHTSLLGGRFNVTISSYQYRKSRYEGKMESWPFHLYNGNPYTDRITKWTVSISNILEKIYHIHITTEPHCIMLTDRSVLFWHFPIVLICKRTYVTYHPILSFFSI